MKSKEKVRGAHAWSVFIPTIIIITILHLSVIITTLLINSYSAKASNKSHETTKCVETVSSLQTRVSKLSETFTSFALTPVIPNGEDAGKINDTPLITYYEEYIKTNPKSIMDSITSTDVVINQSTLKLLNDSVNIAIDLETQQLHMLSLLTTMEYMVDDTNKEKINEICAFLATKSPLTDEERALPDSLNGPPQASKTGRALQTLSSRDYGQPKGTLAENISVAIASIQQDATRTQNSSDTLVDNLRVLLWILTLSIVLIMLIFFAILLKKLLVPIVNFSKDIQKNYLLDDEKGLYEANFLARSYNELFDKRAHYERELTKVAETDPLTGFQNRYGYNKYLKETEKTNCSVCIFMFDVNNLKYVNDTFGHDKGDELIKNSSLCISECFKDGLTKNCFRLGGDEFIAIVDNISESDIKPLLDKFFERQAFYKVSIATGYAYSDNLKRDGYDKLVAIADEAMYKNKKEMKEKKAS